NSLSEWFARKHSRDAHQLFTDNQGIASKCHEALSPRPLLVAHMSVADDAVDQMRPALRSDQTDLRFAHGYAAVRTVGVGVHSRAGLQLEHITVFAQNPDACQSGIQVTDHGLHTYAQDGLQTVAPPEGIPDFNVSCCEAYPLLQGFLCLQAFSDVIRQD